MDNVRNPEGIWINSSAFKEASNQFQKSGVYCAAPQGSPEWREYWETQRERCLHGFSVGGARITGDHYNYLNFCPIQKLDNSGNAKIKGFPDFWDGDYNYFWARDLARHGIFKALYVDPREKDLIMSLEDAERDERIWKLYDTLGMHFKPKDTQNLMGALDMIVAKARRKGYSYKNSSIGLNNLLHRRGSYTMYMAYEKKYLYPSGIFTMMTRYLSFIKEHTAFSMPADYIDKQDHIRNSYKKYVDGRAFETGMMSEVQALTFKDNPDAGRGKDAYEIIGEEVGAWGTPGGLKATLAAMRPSTMAGAVKTGLITLFGTSGDMEGGTIDFSEIHRKPNAYGFMEFYDYWGPLEGKTEGFFHPVHYNREGYYDDQGNSDLEGAKKNVLRIRKQDLDNNLSAEQIQLKIQEDPLNSAEAFALSSVNDFPTIELQTQLDIINAEGLQEKKGIPAKLFYNEKGEVAYKYILDGSSTPITSFYDVPADRRGCLVIYEPPQDNAEPGLYKIGYDPVRHDEGTSLAAIIVFKGTRLKDGSRIQENIVAEYYGRQTTAEDHDFLAMQLAELYNTQVMFENEVPATRRYFQQKGKLNLLALQPDKVIGKNTKASRVARIYGCHMSVPLKLAGERYIKEWLLEIGDHDEHGNPIRNVQRLYSRRLIEELIRYDPKGNFDAVSAMIMCMMQVQEVREGKTYGEKKQSSKLLRMIKLLER